MIVSLTVLTVICVVVVLHPYLTYPVTLLIVRRFRPRPLVLQNPAPSTYAIVCCAHNEMPVIASKLANMLALQKRLGNCEILIHSDGSDDGTAEYLAAFQGTVTVSISRERLGKSVGMNTLVSRTTAEIIIFTDADVIIDVESVTNVCQYFRDQDVGCVAGQLRSENESDNVTARLGALYWRFDEWLKQLESDSGSAVGAYGALFAIRRSLFEPTPPHIIDDFHTSISVYCSGKRVVRAPDFIAYVRAANTRKDEIGRKIRIACRAFNCHRLLWPRIKKLPFLMVYNYVSHKLIRWLAAYIMFIGALSATLLIILQFGLTIFLIVLGAVSVAGVLAAKGYLPFLSPAWEALIGVSATGLGIYKALRGKRFQTWDSAPSTRSGGSLQAGDASI